MPFTDTNEGSTHSYNDGCGEPEHNDAPQDPVEVTGTDTCQCKEMTCKKGCDRNHTHKTFFCEKCEPEACKKMESQPPEKTLKHLVTGKTIGTYSEDCKCENPYCEHLTSDFDKFCNTSSPEDALREGVAMSELPEKESHQECACGFAWSHTEKHAPLPEIKTTIQNIGMMRQWLNEDRITDPKNMVTNEDILHWLNWDFK